MATIQDYLDLIKNAIYGKDVRQAIHDGIQQCYCDGKAGSTDLEARQRLDSVEPDVSSLKSRMSTAENDIDVLDSRVDQIVAPSGEAPSSAEVADARIGEDGTTYLNLGDAVRKQVSRLKDDVSQINAVAFNDTEISCELADGTLANPNNANAVNIVTRIPCSKGETVEIYPVRVNASGYYYQYAYRVYDHSSNLLIDANTASENNKSVKIVSDNAAYIRFAIFEYNGTAYNPLRSSTFGSTPYAVVRSAKNLKSEVEWIKRDLDYLYKVEPIVEIGVNRFLSNGSVIKAENVWRASTEPSAPISNSVLVTPEDKYWITVYTHSNGEWSEHLTNQQETFALDFTGIDIYFFQIGRIDGLEIPSDAVPFDMRVNMQKMIDDGFEFVDDNFALPLVVENGVNRVLNNDGTITIASNSARASTIPVKIESTKILVRCEPEYSWNMYKSSNGSNYTEIETLVTGDLLVDVDLNDYVFFQIRKINGGNFAEDEESISILSCDLAKQVGNKLNSQTNTINLLFEGVGYERVTLANGTLVNPYNANAVCTSNYVPVVEGNEATCIVGRPPDAEGYVYYYAYQVFNANKELMLSVTDAKEENKTVIIPINGAYIKYAIFQNDGNGNFVPLNISKISDDDVVVKVASSASASGSGSYYDTKKAEAKIIKLKKINGEAYGECDAKFLFVTDIHHETERTERMVSIANAWGAEYISAVLNGGDTVTTVITESLDWYYDLVNNLDIPVLNAVGNHDAWASLGVLETDSRVVYDKIIAPIVSSSDIVQPTDAETNGYNYYYKDFNDTVRVIVIDCMFWDTTQLAWFESVLGDAKTSNLHVVAVSHAAFPWTSMETVDCLWSKAGLLTNYSDGGAINDPTRTNLQAAQAVKDFMDAGGTFICWLTGHQHGDDVHILPDYGNQFVVTMGSFAQRASMLQKSDSVNDYNYDCLTYITIDTSNKAIKFLRIGADIDMYGVKHNGLSIKYDVPKLIASW